MVLFSIVRRTRGITTKKFVRFAHAKPPKKDGEDCLLVALSFTAALPLYYYLLNRD